MKPSNRRYALNGVLMLCASVACDDAIVGRRWPIEAPSSASSSGGAQTSEASGSSSTSGGSASAHGGPRATDSSAGARSSGGASSGSSSTCTTGLAVHPSIGVCATVPAQGDVDCNGVVDINDALKLGQVVDRVQSWALYEPAGDLNCDGCLTKDDATLIAKITAGSYVAHACDDSE